MPGFLRLFGRTGLAAWPSALSSTLPALARFPFARFPFAGIPFAGIPFARFPFARVAVAAVATFAAGCTPSIGDQCTSSADCSVRGDRQCDTAQPGGYCTVLSCNTNGCPGGSACIAFQTNVAGCSYSDRVIARTARSYCLKGCDKDDDCRSGYVCRDPREKPWSALILDDAQDRKVCIPEPPSTSLDTGAAGEDAGVCQASAPDGGPILVERPDGGPVVDSGADGADGGPPDGGSPDSGADPDAGDASDGGG